MLSPLKSLVRRTALARPLRYVTQPVYERVTDLELRAIRTWDDFVRPSPRPFPAPLVTAIVKTFERPREVARLVQSLHAHFPGLEIIVADDSREAINLPGVTLVRLPFDSGVSAGRQAALDRVRTPYTWLLDDDFVVFGGTRLDLALRVLEEQPRIDILGGPLIYLPLLAKRRGDPNALFPTSAAPLVSPGTQLGGCVVRDKVPNFFVARSERLRLVGWTRELKRLDHADFFTRARGVLVAAFCEEFVGLHAQTPFDAHYQSYRQAIADDRAVLNRRYGG